MARDAREQHIEQSHADYGGHDVQSDGDGDGSRVRQRAMLTAKALSGSNLTTLKVQPGL